MISAALPLRFRELGFATSVAVCLIAVMSRPGEAQPSQAPKPVTVANTISDTVKSGQTFVGSVTPSRIATIGSAVDGRVESFKINESDRVEKGAELAQLLTETITSELKTAVRDWQLRIAELKELDPRQEIKIDGELRQHLIDEKLLPATERPEAQQTADSREDDGAKLVGKLDKEIAEADSLRKAAEASLRTETSDHQRILDLRKRGIATEQELEAAQLELDLAKATLDERTAIARYARSTKEFRINQALERIRMQEAIVEKLIDQKRKHTIITRFDGYITAEFTEEGAWVNRGDPVAEVAALDFVDVRANVLESQIRYIRKGDPIRIEIPALPDRVFTGTVEAIVPKADLPSRTFPVKIRVENEVSGDVPLIKSGMLARAMLPTGTEIKALFVPKDAINLGGRTPEVYVVQQKSKEDETGTATPVSVRLGIAHGSLIEVSGELKEGDLVVVRGNERLKPKDEVRITARIDSHDLKETAPVSVRDGAETAEAADAEPAATGKLKK